MAAELYRQLPLLEQTDSIRLLSLHAANQLDAPIAGTLFSTRLGDNSPYEALSYTWGPPFEGQVLEDGIVILNGTPLTVTGNLCDALRRLRYKVDCRVLWIDAVCINQQDHREKGSQVRQMGKTFGNASRTIIWLGEDSEEKDGEFFLGFAAASVSRRRWSQSGWTSEWSRSENGSDHIQQAVIPGDLVVSQMRSTFRRRRYFSRRWIVQEVRSSSKIICVCGRSSTSWSYLLHTLGNSNTKYNGRRHFPAVIPGFLLPHPSSKLYHYDKVISELCWYSMLDCKDPRDRVYALLHVFGFEEFATDYTEECSDVYTRFFHYMVDRGSTTIPWENHIQPRVTDSRTRTFLIAFLLSIAAYQNQQRLQLGLKSLTMPSWVPDWTQAACCLADAETFEGPQEATVQGASLFLQVAPFGTIQRTRSSSHGCFTEYTKLITTAGCECSMTGVPNVIEGLRPQLEDGDVLCSPYVLANGGDSDDLTTL